MPRHEVRYAIDIEQDLANVYIESAPGSGVASAWNAGTQHLAVNPENCKEAFLPDGTFACFEAPIWIQFAHFPLDSRVIILHVSLQRPSQYLEGD
jgi:hypothetical protein